MVRRAERRCGSQRLGSYTQTQYNQITQDQLSRGDSKRHTTSKDCSNESCLVGSSVSWKTGGISSQGLGWVGLSPGLCAQMPRVPTETLQTHWVYWFIFSSGLGNSDGRSSLRCHSLPIAERYHIFAVFKILFPLQPCLWLAAVVLLYIVQCCAVIF